MPDKDINLINSQEFCSENKSEKQLFLVQLPKELNGKKNLKFNFNELKNGSIVEIVRFSFMK
jgi:hypothetical protein